MAGRPETSTALRVPRALALLGAIVLLIGLALAADFSSAKNLRGTKGAERLVGTQRADTIKGMGGKDKIKGKGGNDKLSGGKGRDAIAGGGGADKMAGGVGNDVIKAADGRRDKAINGGPGKNRCVIDTALELSITRHCSSISGAPGSGGGNGSGGGLHLLTGTGLVCGSQLPNCVFTISGDGADGTIGTVTGGGGVTAVGGSVTTSGSDWSAGGLYGCTDDGFLRVTIGSESVDVPVDCTV